jgi:hypothetical protein
LMMASSGRQGAESSSDRTNEMLLRMPHPPRENQGSQRPDRRPVP